MWRFAVLVSLAACRYRFDALGDAGDDDGSLGQPVMLKVTVTGPGTGHVRVTATDLDLDCTSSCAASVLSGTPLHVVGRADPGAWFRGWTAGCTGRHGCVLTVGAAGLAITGDFIAEPNRMFLFADRTTGRSPCRAIRSARSKHSTPG